MLLLDFVSKHVDIRLPLLGDVNLSLVDELLDLLQLRTETLDLGLQGGLGDIRIPLVLASVLREHSLHFLKLPPLLVSEGVLACFAHLDLADVLDVGSEALRERLEGLLDLLEAGRDLLCLELSQFEEVLLHVGLLLLDSLAESRSEFSTLHQDETLGVLPADSPDGGLPLLQIAELGPDVLVVSVVPFPVLEDEVSVEVVDDPTGFELLHDLLELVEVEGNAPLYGRLGGAVCLRVLDDGPEARATIADEPVDELVEVLVADDSAYLLGDALHVLKDLLELSDELALGWLEGHVFLGEAHSGLDAVLFRVLGHLREDEVGTLLVDSDLGFDDHVVDEPDEGAEAVVVSFGELQHSIFEGVLLLLEHHRLVLGGLAHLRVL